MTLAVAVPIAVPAAWSSELKTRLVRGGFCSSGAREGSRLVPAPLRGAGEAAR